jgi:ribosome maturation factor RimP
VRTEQERTTDPVAQRIAAVAAPLAAGVGADVLDVEVLTGRQRVVRLVVDAALDADGAPSGEGLDIDRIARLSRLIGDALDEQDPMSAAYTLEVTSPGTDRPLVEARDFARNVGRRVRVELRAGTGVDGDAGTLEGVVEDVDRDRVVLAIGTERRDVPLDVVERGIVVLPW